MALNKDQVIRDQNSLRHDAASLLTQADELVERAEAEGRILSEVEQAEFDSLVEQANALEQRQAEEQRQITLSAQRQAIADVRGRFNGRPNPADVLTRGAVARVSSMRHLWADDPKKGYKSHRDFLLDVIKASTGGRETEQLAYLKIRGAAGGDEHSTFSDPYGGYLVPAGFSPDMMKIQPEDDPTAGRTMTIPMSTPILSFPARVDKTHTTSVSGGLRVYRRAEADTVTASRMQMEQITLRANPLMGLSYASEELLTDSPVSFVAIIQAGFQDEFASKLLAERLSGTGVGEYLGVMLSPALISVSRTTSSDFVYADAVNMMSRSYGFSRAVWIMNHSVIPKLATLALEVGAGGGPVFVKSAVESMPSSLFGRPVFFSEYLAALGSAGDVLLCDWSQYIEGLYQPLNSAESIHVRFVNNERAFRFTARNDGAPWWRSVLTPKNGSTLSPYVTLAA